MQTNSDITPQSLRSPVSRMFELAASKCRAIETSWNPANGTAVFTVAGKYTSRGWTEWTQGFQYGCQLLAFEATGDKALLDTARKHVLNDMAAHVTHIGVHDHGFNNLSTYGVLRRLMREGRIPSNDWEMHFYDLAIKCSGAVQAARWSTAENGGGYVYSFNGPHSLFIDTIRTIRTLGAAHALGHVLMGENDVRISLLDRALTHAITSARHNVFYGEGRDAYDVRGRVAHEAIFNINDGRFRCTNSQQGFSPFSTWTRGLAWAVLGFPEQIEFLQSRPSGQVSADALKELHKAASTVCDFYISGATAADGIPYWDTGAPLLHKLGDWQSRPAEPFNDQEPVDSSAAAIAAQGLIRYGLILGEAGKRYLAAGLTTAQTLLAEPYLSTSPAHQGLLLHSIYHRPRGWDYIPPGRRIPCGESSLWGDYHLMELGLVISRLAEGKPLPVFW